MLDAKRLLDQFLGSQGAGHYGGRPGTGGGLGGGLGDLARTLGGGSRGGPAGGLGGLGGALGGLGGGMGGGLGGVGGGALAGSLAGLLMGSKHGRKLGGSALQMGGMAVVGALAYRAYQDWQAGQQPATTPAAPASAPMLPAPTGTPFNPVNEADQQKLGLSLLRAMIAAAKADGHVDAEEQQNIFGQIDKLELDSEAKAFVVDELRAPLDIDAVARGATSPEAAAEIYAASLLAIDVDNAAERGYLAMLAARLKLDDALVQHLHVTIEGATEKV